MLSGMYFSSLADCAVCRVQGAVVETWDPGHPVAGAEARATAKPVPISSECRMCGRSLEQGAEVRPARKLDRIADVQHALTAWAKAEGFATLDEFVASSFVLGNVAAVHTALILGEPVETSFDVMGFLFSHTGGALPGTMDEPVTTEKLIAAPPPARLDPLGERPLHPRNELLALISVALADGALVPQEQAFLVEDSQARGLAPPQSEELRVYRPDEVGPVGGLLDRERVLERMVKCACCDGVVDESEVRVLRSYARAWGVDPQRVERWLAEISHQEANVFARVRKSIARHLFPEA
jgi:hypothetical protein